MTIAIQQGSSAKAGAGAPVLLAAFTICIIAFGWVGYYGSDDMSYAGGAIGWLENFPYVGDSHWTLRHTVVIPIAILFGFFGPSEVALVLPTILYFLAILALTYFVVQRYFDWTVACLAIVLIASLP